jgi:predicted lipid carrier protein YhbT
MDNAAFPIVLARGMMQLMPPPLLNRGVALLLRRMGRNHPDLFENLAELGHTTIHIEPTDLPQRFRLSFGDGPLALRLARPADPPADATVKGTLESLLALLEGRIDSDALFFTRELSIVGDTSAVVALRNTLDRDTIDVLDEATSLLGPLRRVGRAAVLGAERRAERLRDRLVAVVQRGVAPSPDAGRDVAAECDTLRTEVATLKTRLAKLEARQRRKEAEA